VTIFLGPLVATISCGAVAVAVVATAVWSWAIGNSMQTKNVWFRYPYASGGTAQYTATCVGRYGTGCTGSPYTNVYWTSATAAYWTRWNITYAAKTRNQMEQERLRGKAPKGIEGVHGPHGNVPNAQEHVHVNGGGINKNGSIHDSKPGPLTGAQKEWLRRFPGWKQLADKF